MCVHALCHVGSDLMRAHTCIHTCMCVHVCVCVCVCVCVGRGGGGGTLTKFLIELSHRQYDSLCLVHLCCDNTGAIEILHLCENLISSSEVSLKDISQVIIHIKLLNY